MSCEEDRQFEYTVIVECSDSTAQSPNFPMKAYVLPTTQLSPADFKEIHAAAVRGGCMARIFWAKKDSLEEVKQGLESYSDTKPQSR